MSAFGFLFKSLYVCEPPQERPGPQQEKAMPPRDADPPVKGYRGQGRWCWKNLGDSLPGWAQSNARETPGADTLRILIRDMPSEWGVEPRNTKGCPNRKRGDLG